MPMLRGLEKHQETDPSQLLRDTRTLSQKFFDFLANSAYVAIALFTMAAAGFIMPGVADLFLVIGLVAFVYTRTRKQMLPFRMPLGSDMPDYNDLKPGSNKPNTARGICFFGNEKKTNAELWFNNDDMRTHVLIFGSTGSGKTEALVSLAYNALAMGSGFIYVDGKGDNSLYAKAFSMARRMGRDDDLLLVNFMTGARDIVGPQEKRLSNTLNPFATGSSSMLAQLVVSLMDSSAATPDGDMWKGRAISFVEALMKILVYVRDEGYLLLDAHTIRNYFTLDRIEAMVVDKTLLRTGQDPVSLADAPSVVLEPVNSYLDNLPGWDKAKKGKQSSQTLEQHGFITMQLTRVFTSLADTYGHIMRTNLAEVDMRDVVLNRRILIVLLPAMEKSPDELSNLGKVIVATLKAMMATGLGEQVEGDYRDVIERKPTNSKTPYMCILDEYGYYAVDGFAVVPAQARSLGFSAIFAGQDLPAFQKVSKEEALSIGANTNIKIAMKLEDPVETWDFFMKTAGESYVTKVDHFQTSNNSLMNNYLDNRSASFEKRQRIDLLDLKEQRPGEMHIFFNSTIVRANVFYADPPPVKKMRLNQFVKVDVPPTRLVAEVSERLQGFEALIKNDDLVFEASGLGSDVNFLLEEIAHQADIGPIEKGVNALLAYQEHLANEQAAKSERDYQEIAQGELNVFSRVELPGRYDDLGEPLIDMLLPKGEVREQVDVVERMVGKAEHLATNISDEIVKDMTVATTYPPVIKTPIDAAKLAEVTSSLVAYVNEKKAAHAANAADTKK